MSATIISWKLVAEVTGEVRRGRLIDDAVAEIASEFDVNPVVLRDRFDKAWPSDVMAEQNASARW